MEVDDMLALAGDFGRCQYLMMALFCVINVLSAFHYFAQTFISIEPDHWCKGSNHSQCGDNTTAQTCEAGWEYNLTWNFETVVSEVWYIYLFEILLLKSLTRFNMSLTICMQGLKL